MRSLQGTLNEVWYGGRHPLALLLRPLAWVFCLVARLRRMAYLGGLFGAQHLPVPVIVVGNLTVGGAGKTPLVIWLARSLRARGRRPGIITRGYGGRAAHWPQQVRPDSDPFMVGDEPVVLARRTDCPVAAAPDRVAAARDLLRFNDCDMIIADDGLQHLALGRDLEIAVVDGIRRFGNGLCLPAGPLREPARRLDEVDLVVANGATRRGEFAMRYRPGLARRLSQEETQRAAAEFAPGAVHGVAGIAHPERFFSQLRGMGLRVIAHPFADHHPYAPGELDFDDQLPVLMTEKDAVKYRPYAGPRHWYLPVEAELHPMFEPRLMSLLQRRDNGQQTT